MGILRRYNIVDAAEALMTGGEAEYRKMANLQGLALRGFRKGYGGHFVHPELRIQVKSDTLTNLHMLPALDAMMARKRRELGLDG